MVNFVLFVKMTTPEEKQLYDVASSQCLDGVPTSSDNVAEPSIDSPVQPNQCLDVVCTSLLISLLIEEAPVTCVCMCVCVCHAP